MEIHYASSTHGLIPLSKHGKQLMARLRFAIQASIRKGYYTYDKSEDSVGYTRGELAQYISALEKRAAEDKNYIAQLRFQRDKAFSYPDSRTRKMCNADLWPELDAQSLRWAEKNLSQSLYSRWLSIYAYLKRKRPKSGFVYKASSPPDTWYGTAAHPRVVKPGTTGNRADMIIMDEAADMPIAAHHRDLLERWYRGSTPWKSWHGGPANLHNLPRADGAVPPFKNFRKAGTWTLERRPTSTASDTVEWSGSLPAERRYGVDRRQDGGSPTIGRRYGQRRGSTRCNERWRPAYSGRQLRCKRPAGHDGPHKAYS